MYIGEELSNGKYKAKQKELKQIKQMKKGNKNQCILTYMFYNNIKSISLFT